MTEEYRPSIEECIKRLFPTQRITESTADAVIASLYATPAELLRRFEFVKQLANLADGERDGLRKYIQKHFDAGMYDSVLLSVKTGAVQVYPNADGKHALVHYLLINSPAMANFEEATAVIVIETTANTAEEFIDLFFTMSRDEAVQYVSQNFVGAGFVIDNNLLYSAKGSKTLTITEIPNDACKAVAVK